MRGSAGNLQSRPSVSCEGLQGAGQRRSLTFSSVAEQSRNASAFLSCPGLWNWRRTSEARSRSSRGTAQVTEYSGWLSASLLARTEPGRGRFPDCGGCPRGSRRPSLPSLQTNADAVRSQPVAPRRSRLTFDDVSLSDGDVSGYSGVVTFDADDGGAGKGYRGICHVAVRRTHSGTIGYNVAGVT